MLVRDVRRDPRLAHAMPGVGSAVVHPIRFGDELLGTVEVDHPKRHVYGAKDLVALGTLANQMATAIHIAELRRPLLSTVDQIGDAGRRARAGHRVAARLGDGAGRRLAAGCGTATAELESS